MMGMRRQETGTPLDETEHVVDVAIVGAGPTGLAAARECERRGLSHVVLDRAGLAQSFVEYPQNLLFFSPPEEMEIGGLPLPVAGGLKPTRETYLAYLRAVAKTLACPLLTWHAIVRVEAVGGGYRLHTRRTPNGSVGPQVRATTLIVATGLWHAPRRLGVAGEDLPHVIREFTEPTPYFGQPVLVIGGGNSAVGAALSLAEAGARPTLSMRRPPKNYRSGLRPFVKRDLAFAIQDGAIRLLANTAVCEIKAETALLQPVRYMGDEDLSEGDADNYTTTSDPFEIPARFVFSLIGHRPDTAFLSEVLGLDLQPSGRPVADATRWETSRPNIFVAGSLADHAIDIVLKLREQARQVVGEIAQRLNETRESARGERLNSG